MAERPGLMGSGISQLSDLGLKNQYMDAVSVYLCSNC